MIWNYSIDQLKDELEKADPLEEYSVGRFFSISNSELSIKASKILRPRECIIFTSSRLTSYQDDKTLITPTFYITITPIIGVRFNFNRRYSIKFSSHMSIHNVVKSIISKIRKLRGIKHVF